MSHVFSDLEGLRIAMEMEKRGEAFYSRAARLSRADDTVALLNQLAAEERGHYARFEALYEAECESRDAACEEAYDPEVCAYLSAIAADIIFPGGLMALRQSGFESSEGVLRVALASEKDSILFYDELARCARDAHARDIFTEIARQEREHMLSLQRRLNAHLGNDESL